jgi:hypothetical protein
MINITYFLLLCVYVALILSELSWPNLPLFVEGYLSPHRHLVHAHPLTYVIKSNGLASRHDKGVSSLSASDEGQHRYDRLTSHRSAPPSRNNVLANSIKKFSLALLLLGATPPISTLHALASDLAITDKTAEMSLVKLAALDNSQSISTLSIFTDSLNRLRSGFTGLQMAEPPVGERFCSKLTTAEVRTLFNTWADALRTLNPSTVADLYWDDSILLPTLSSEPRPDRSGKLDYFADFLAKKPVASVQYDYVSSDTCNAAQYR